MLGARSILILNLVRRGVQGIALIQQCYRHITPEINNVLPFIGDTKPLSILLRPRCRSRFRGRRFLIFPFATTRRLAPSCMSDF